MGGANGKDNNGHDKDANNKNNVDINITNSNGGKRKHEQT